MTNMTKPIKSCHSCIYLHHFEDGPEGPEAGYYCDGREYYNERAESAHLAQIGDLAYRLRPKKCCVVATKGAA